LFVTRVGSGDLATEQPLIDKFWESLKLKM
jgi:hypothetical protein